MTGTTIYVNNAGTLFNGYFIGGYTVEYWFRDGTADSNLVRKYFISQLDSNTFLMNTDTVRFNIAGGSSGGGSLLFSMALPGSTPNAYGASYNSTTGVFQLQPAASGQYPGIVSTGSQYLGGDPATGNPVKTFGLLEANQFTVLNGNKAYLPQIYGTINAGTHQSNLSVTNGQSISTIESGSTNSAMIWGLAAKVQARVSIRGSVTADMSAVTGSAGIGENYASFEIGTMNVKLAASGVHQWAAQQIIKPLTVTQNGTSSLVNTANLVLEDISTATVTGKNYNFVTRKGVDWFETGIRNRRVGINDAAYSINDSDFLICFTSLTAPRAVTLPSASLVSGQTFTIKDESGAAGSYPITITGTVDGYVNPVAVDINFGYYTLYSNGAAYFKTDETASEKYSFKTVTQSGGALAIDAGDGSVNFVTNLTASITSLNLINIREGHTYRLQVIQPASGGPYTITLPATVSNVFFGFGSGTTIYTTATQNAVDDIYFYKKGSNYYYSTALDAK